MAIVKRKYGRNHGYLIDGVKADGVTTLLGEAIVKEAIGPWAAKTVAEYVADSSENFLFELRAAGRDSMVNHLKGIPWAQRDAAAAKGTEVHHFAEALISGATVDCPEELVGHVMAAVDFMNEWKPTPVLVETVVASRTWNYAGTLDLVADLPDGRRVLWDYKTGKRIYPEVAMQLAAYRYAENWLGDDGTEMPMAEIGIDACYICWIRADGYDAIPVRADEDVFRAFLHAAQVARNNRHAKEWVMPAQQSPFISKIRAVNP